MQINRVGMNLDCKCNIVLVDDDFDDQFLFSEAYEELNKSTELCMFNNGKELCSYLFEAKEFLPKLIFLDLNMPFMNGFECLEVIRKNETFNDVGVVIYSTSDNSEDIQQTFKLGANFYMKKPDDFSKLKRLMSKALVLEDFSTRTIAYDQFVLSA